MDPKGGNYWERALRQVQDGVEVAVSVLGPEESRKALGLPVDKADIQPVWISIENPTSEQMIVILPAVDADYFSPSEAVYLSRHRYRRWRNKGAHTRFLRESLRILVPPRVGVSGFVYTNRVLGYRHIHVLLIGAGHRYDFHFRVWMPGPRMDYDKSGIAARAADCEMVDVSGDDLRQRLADMPYCTTNRSGKRMGDPLNVALVSPPDGDVIHPLLRGGWVLTEATGLGSTWRTVRAFLLGGQYRHSPISPLYAFGRPQDVALQKIRWSIHERNHMRLWLTPLLWEGRHVILGQISRDIGVRLTRRTRILTTHRIDPDVDHARNALILDLGQEDCVEASGWIRMSDPISPETPRRNLTGDPWWSDGMRLVGGLSNGDAPPEHVRTLGWDEAPPWI